MIDDSFVMCFNAHHESIAFTMPPAEFGAAWQPVLDTAAGPAEVAAAPAAKAAEPLRVHARTMVVLQAME